MEGERLGPYRIESELGSGGMGTVHLATVEGEAPGLPVGRRVALKIVHPHLLGQPGFFKRFLREAEIGRRVRHENVVATYDMDVADLGGKTTLYLAMEYVEGRTLREMLGELGAVPESLLREIARQVADGLSAIHASDIVHRDLKPENVLVTKDHHVRIMDLGVARLVDESVALTKRGEFAGSIVYAAPEQFSRADVGPSADLYSLGVLLYELATGDNPFRRDDAAQIIAAHLNETPQRASEVSSEVSSFLAEICDVLLAKRAEQRFESAALLRDLLRDGEGSEWWTERERALLDRRVRLPRIPVRRDTRLFGRDPEMEVLRSAWESARDGAGRCVLVEGEAGIGKTRLADAFLHEIEDASVRVLYGSYPPSGGLGGISDAVLDHFGAADLDENLCPYLDTTPTLAPAFAALLKHERPPPGSTAISGDALHAVLCNLLRALAREKPLVWVVDDLHFAEEDSRSLVLSLARAVADEACLLIVTTRPRISEEDLAHYGRLGHVKRISLGRLGARLVIELLQDAFRSKALADRLGAKIAYKSDGVPFFAFEMIRGLKESGLLDEREDGSWEETSAIEDIEVPSAVLELIQARFADIDEDEQELLNVAACCGYQFDPGLVAEALGRELIPVLRRLARLEKKRRLIRSVGLEFVFDHHQIQEALHDGLPGMLRQEYHAAVARAMERRLGPESEAPETARGSQAVDLCTHWLEAGRRPAAARYLEAALDHLEAGFHNEAVIRLIDRVLEFRDIVDGTETVQLLLRKVRRLNLLGRRQEERRAVREAFARAKELGDPGPLAEAATALGFHLNVTARYERGAVVLRRAIALARKAGDRTEEFAATIWLGATLWDLNRYEDSRALYEQVRGLAGEIDDPAPLGWTLANLGAVATMRGRYAEARDSLEASLAISVRTGDQRMEAYGRDLKGHLHVRLGEQTDAEREIASGIELARGIGDRRREMWCLNDLGSLHHERGEGTDAVRRFEACLRLAVDMKHRQGEAAAAGNLGRCLVDLGDLEAAREHLDRQLAIARADRDVRQQAHALHGLGHLAVNAGDPGRARELFGRALVQRREIEYRRGIVRSRLALARLDARDDETDAAIDTLREVAELGLQLEDSTALLLATVLVATLPGGDPATGKRAVREYESGSRHTARMEACFLLWKATDDPEMLAAAHDLLTSFRDRAPTCHRESLLERVPLHREIARAQRTRGDVGPGSPG